jgi:hypothetical protein
MATDDRGDLFPKSRGTWNGIGALCLQGRVPSTTFPVHLHDLHLGPALSAGLFFFKPLFASAYPPPSAMAPSERPPRVARCDGMSERWEACWKKVNECQRLALVTPDTAIRLMYLDLANQWRELAE